MYFTVKQFEISRGNKAYHESCFDSTFSDVVNEAKIRSWASFDHFDGSSIFCLSLFPLGSAWLTFNDGCCDGGGGSLNLSALKPSLVHVVIVVGHTGNLYLFQSVRL